MAVRNAEEAVEAMIGRRPCRAAMAQMPFAKQRRRITSRLQCLGDGDFREREAALVVLQDYLVSEAGTYRLSPRNQSGA